VSALQPSANRVFKGHKELREALRDTQTYSSDLQGDADVRDYRQLPLEVDPPRHHLYRSALAPIFVKPSIERHVDAFTVNTKKIVEDYFKQSNQNVVSNLALPIVMQNLGVIYNRPQDVAEWISWGPDVWTAESEQRSGEVLHRYLDRIYEEALIGSSDDVWRQIATMEIEGQQVSASEFRGIAGVLLAGGRDTVVKLLTGIIWHLARKPSDLQKLRNNPDLVSAAIQEFLRFFSPLPMMNRTMVPESGRTDLPDDRYVGMSFISGNFDTTVFENPFEVNLERPRNPHLSFGFGPHTCLGNHIAEIEAKVFIRVIIESGKNLVVEEEDISFHKPPLEMVPDQFRYVALISI
jgi:cytochrome P450